MAHLTHDRSISNYYYLALKKLTTKKLNIQTMRFIGKNSHTYDL